MDGFKNASAWSSLVVQWVSDPALSLQQQLGLLLWLGFDPWPKNFHILLVWSKKKKKRESQLCEEIEFDLWSLEMLLCLSLIASLIISEINIWLNFAFIHSLEFLCILPHVNIHICKILLGWPVFWLLHNYVTCSQLAFFFPIQLDIFRFIRVDRDAFFFSLLPLSSSCDYVKVHLSFSPEKNFCRVCRFCFWKQMAWDVVTWDSWCRCACVSPGHTHRRTGSRVGFEHLQIPFWCQRAFKSSCTNLHSHW